MAGPELEDADAEADTGGASDSAAGGDVIADFDGEDTGSGGDPGIEGVGEVDLGIEDDDGLVDGFDGFDGGETSDSSASGDSGGSSTASGGSGPSVASAIEEGMAEVAVIGLTGSQRKQVRREMQAIAGQFKLGYFGEQCVQKYLKKDIEDIPPEYGLAASLVAFLAIAVYKRPDGSEKMREAFGTVKATLTGSGDDAADQPQPTTTSSSDDGDSAETSDADTSEDDTDE